MTGVQTCALPIWIGVRAYGDENTGKYYNFSPVFKMSSDFSQVEEVTNWDEEL